MSSMPDLFRLRATGLQLLCRARRDLESFERLAGEREWNDAVVRASYAAEKLVKAIVCFLGAAHVKEHGKRTVQQAQRLVGIDFEGHMAQWSAMLDAIAAGDEGQPVLSLFAEEGFAVVVLSLPREIQVLKVANNVWSQTGSATSGASMRTPYQDRITYEALTGHVKDGYVTIGVLEKPRGYPTILQVPRDTTGYEWTCARRSVEHLARWRLPAEYGERRFGPAQYQQAKVWLDAVRSWLK